MVVQTHCIQRTGIPAKLFYKTVGREKWEPDVDEVVINQERIVRPYHRDTVSLFGGQHRSTKQEPQGINRIFYVISDISSHCMASGTK